MKRKDFLVRSLVGTGTLLSISSVFACTNDTEELVDTTTTIGTDGEVDFESSNAGECTLSPNETAGPYPTKTPAQLIRENIVADRKGVALLINLIVQDQSNACSPIEGAYVDVWHCDADGNYSEYGSNTSQHYLRGRQETDANGLASFLSIYPGWYRGRAPHIHLEVFDASGISLKTTQIAFPEEISNTVYATSNYNGAFDTSNSSDGIFRDSLSLNMIDSITGNISDGYVINKNINV